MGAGSSHLPGPGSPPASVILHPHHARWTGGGSGRGTGTAVAPGVDAVTEILPACGVSNLPCAVAGVHVLDNGHISHLGTTLRRVGLWEHSTVLLLAAAHLGSGGRKPVRAALVLLLSGTGSVHVLTGGERAGACGVCGSRADVRVSDLDKYFHVDHLSAVTATADATEPSWCSVNLQFGATPRGPPSDVTLTVTSEAATCLLSHIRTLRALSRGIPPTPDGLAVTGTLAHAPWAPPQPTRHDLSILLGFEIAMNARGPVAPEEMANWNIMTIVQTLVANGLLDISKSPVGRRAIEALLPALSQHLARGTPVLKGVKFAPSSSGA